MQIKILTSLQGANIGYEPNQIIKIDAEQGTRLIQAGFAELIAFDKPVKRNNIFVYLMTYNRPELCERLVKQINDQLKESHCELNIYNDGSIMTYPKFNNYYKTQHYGKERWWEFVNIIFNQARKNGIGYHVFMPDDIKIEKGFFKKLLKHWEQINDSKKIALNYYTNKERLDGRSCWTGQQWIDFNSEIANCGWVDMAFLCTEDFFIVMPQITIINRGWDKYPELGSGVGSQISHVLYPHYNMYILKTPLATSATNESQMNYAQSR